MAGSVNKVVLIGNVGKDPEIRSTNDGRKIANLSIATSDTWKDKSTGERKEKTEWHRVVIFNEGLAGVVEKYVRKGSKLYVSGSLQTRKWTDQSGAEKYSTEVVLQGFNSELVLLDGPSSQNREDLNVDGGFGSGGDSGRGTEKTAQRSNVGQQSASKSRGFDKALDDEIPF